MADPPSQRAVQEERQHAGNTLAAAQTAAVETSQEASHLEPAMDEKDVHESDAASLSSNSVEGEKIIAAERERLEQQQSHATSTSLARTTSTATEVNKKKPWYKTLNPLRWGQIPPVPTKRTPSREATASWLSIVYFQWMAPIMSVCNQGTLKNLARLD